MSSESSAPVALHAGKEKFVKKAKSGTDEMRSEYKLSDFRKLERGRYYERVKSSSNVVVLDPDVAAVFPNSDAVNKALHSLIEIGTKVTRRPSTPKSSAHLRRANG